MIKEKENLTIVGIVLMIFGMIFFGSHWPPNDDIVLTDSVYYRVYSHNDRIYNSNYMS